MISKYNHKELNWVNLDSPSEDELAHILDLYSIPEHLKEKLNITQKEDQIDIDYDYTFVSVYNGDIDKTTLILHDNFIITIHNTPLLGLNKFSKEVELDIIKDQKITNNRLLFAHLLKNLYIGNKEELYTKDIQIQNLKYKLLKQKKKFKLLSRLSAIIIIIIIYVISIIQ